MHLPAAATTTEVDFVVIGVPLDAATSFRTGARFAPEAIRSMSALLHPYNPELQVNPFEVLSGVDYGDCPIVPGYVEESYRVIEETLEPVVGAGVIPVLLGGDHSVTLPELRAVARKHGPVSLVHFDAHFDTRDRHLGQAYGHGTPFRRAVEEGVVDPRKSIHIGIRGGLASAADSAGSDDLGYASATTAEARDMGPEQLAARVHSRVGNAPAFLTFDIDVVDPAFAPGTGTPAVGGLTSWEVLAMLRHLRSLKLVGVDIVEVLPAHDTAGITALLAATVAWELLSVIALSRNHVKQVR